jgi:cytoskeletal protein CcmA (bactofilin family)
MKRLLTLVGICLALTTFAQEKVQRVERDIGSDHFAAGDALVLDKPVAGDLIAAGGKLAVSGGVTGDAVLAGGEVRLDGKVAQGLYMGGGRLTVSGQVARNARVAGGQVEFAAPSEVAGNLTVGGGDVTLKGRVKGYLQVAGGKVLIDGVVDGDVEARAGTLTLGPHARINGKLRYASRDDLARDPAAQVQGALERLAVPGGWPMPDDMERGMGRGGGWVWTTGLLVVASVWVLALPGFARRVAQTLRNRFPLSLLLGFALLVCIPVAAVLFMVTIIGVPLALATLALYPVLLLAAYVGSGVALGDWALTRFLPDRASSRVASVAAAMLGVLVIGVLARLPWAGGIVMVLALLAGLGALGLQLARPAQPA